MSFIVKSKMIKRILILILLSITVNALGAELRSPLWFKYTFPIEGEDLKRMNLPGWVAERAAKLNFDKKYDLSLHMNPFYIPVDFDNDGKIDITVWVKERSTGKKGVAIFIKSQSLIRLVGAGIRFGNGGDDYSWADLWMPLEKTELKKSHWEKHSPRNIGQGIEIIKFESASGAIYWNGKSLEWYQVSD